MNDRVVLGLLGVGALGVMVYLAQNSAGKSLAGVPQFQTEAQFSGLNTGLAVSVNAGTPLDITANEHFFSGEWCCPGQGLVPPKHKYPLVCGGNVTAVINHGMDAMRLGSPDNDWRTQPPSEYAL